MQVDLSEDLIGAVDPSAFEYLGEVQVDQHSFELLELDLAIGVDVVFDPPLQQHRVFLDEEHLLLQHSFLHVFDLLSEQTDRGPLLGVSLDEPEDQLEDRGPAAPVEAVDAHELSCFESEAHLLEDGLVPESDAYVLEDYRCCVVVLWPDDLLAGVFELGLLHSVLQVLVDAVRANHHIQQNPVASWEREEKPAEPEPVQVTPLDHSFAKYREQHYGSEPAGQVVLEEKDCKPKEPHRAADGIYVPVECLVRKHSAESSVVAVDGLPVLQLSQHPRDPHLGNQADQLVVQGFGLLADLEDQLLDFHRDGHDQLAKSAEGEEDADEENERNDEAVDQ